MLRSLPALYRNAYSGLSLSMWIQALVMLINRSGTMVIPFMTVYLTQSLHFSIAESGEVLSVFGAGATCGVYAGGKLTDNIGFFPVQFWSLLLNGLLFLVLGQLRHLWPICGCVFLLALIGEAFRPANAAATAFYSSPDNRTRSYSLNRLAINLGFAIGPAAGGLLATISYGWLFWTDGLTCIVAALILNWLLRPAGGGAVAFAGARRAGRARERPDAGQEAVAGAAASGRDAGEPAPEVAGRAAVSGEDAAAGDADVDGAVDGAVAGMPGEDVPGPAHAAPGKDSPVPLLSAYRDRTYLRFIFFVWMNALSFFQLFSVVPLYYKTAIHMSDAGIGLILAMNGLLIAVIEMVLVYKLENKRPDTLYISYGVLLTALSFGLLAIGPYLWVAVLSMLSITFGEMMSMPFMNSYWISRSSLQNRGQYAALYGIAYSAAQVIAPALGGQVAQHWGFSWLWVILVGVGLLTFWGFRRAGVAGAAERAVGPPAGRSAPKAHN